MLSNSQMQRINGAREIVSEVKTLAKKTGIELIDYQWNQSRRLDTPDDHTLRLVTKDNKSVKGTFSQEELIYYPRRVGTGATKLKLQEMIKDLCR